MFGICLVHERPYMIDTAYEAVGVLADRSRSYKPARTSK